MQLNERSVDEIECISSVLLAIVFAHLIDAHNVSWAAFSGYMVMRGHFLDSLLRALLRIAGTVVGAVLGLFLVPRVEHSLALSALAIGLVGAVTLYRAITAKHAYAWLFLGLTFCMVLLDKLEHTDDVVETFVRSRILETLAGSIACVLVSGVSALTLRRYWPGKRMPAPATAVWHPDAARHACQCGLALMLLPCLGFLWRVPALSDSAITIMAVMLVPLAHTQVSGLVPVSRRLLQRAVGCLAGSALGAAFLLSANGNIAIATLGLIIGVWTGRHIENGQHSANYLGVQFTLAVLVVLVPDSYAAMDIAPGFERLLGILIGLALLEPILLAWHILKRSRMQA